MMASPPRAANRPPLCTCLPLPTWGHWRWASLGIKPLNPELKKVTPSQVKDFLRFSTALSDNPHCPSDPSSLSPPAMEGGVATVQSRLDRGSEYSIAAIYHETSMALRLTPCCCFTFILVVAKHVSLLCSCQASTVHTTSGTTNQPTTSPSPWHPNSQESWAMEQTPRLAG